MNSRVIKTGIFILILCIIIALAGCGSKLSASTKVGFAQTQIDNSWKASYFYFEGTEQKGISVDEGESIFINYEIEQKRGEIKLTIIDEDGMALFTAEDAEGEMQYTADEDTKVYIRVDAEKAKGSFEIDWDVLD